MRPFLTRGTKDKDRCIVLLGEELQRCGVFERVDGILFCEFLGEGDA